MEEYTFSVRMNASVRIQAGSIEEAEQKLATVEYTGDSDDGNVLEISIDVDETPPGGWAVDVDPAEA